MYNILLYEHFYQHVHEILQSVQSFNYLVQYLYARISIYITINYIIKSDEF